MPTESAQATLAVLRDPSLFKWYVIPLFAIVVYIYNVEVSRKNWGMVLAGLAFWGMDWINEIANSLIFHFTNHAPVWGVAKESAFVILMGLNIEICFMFAIAGIAFCRILPEDKKLKILGIPNRLFIAVVASVFCVFVEILLNAAGALTWDWSWWNTQVPYLIFVFGYMPFFLMSFYVYDMEDTKRQVRTVAGIYSVVIPALVVFGALGWI
ncbi:MAG: hypothetical protein KKA60_11580 [Proteobacteria bacterium]|nr:hypothetical protein [Pseudomonadota bacterium]